jgi:hypothetical protein
MHGPDAPQTEFLANTNQNCWGAPPRLSNAFASANAGKREDSLRCVLRLPSTPHGVCYGLTTLFTVGKA